MHTDIDDAGNEFQSTPSAWRETILNCRRIEHDDISIHSLRMEGDSTLFAPVLPSHHFNPLPPHGGRLLLTISFCIAAAFQSTPSAWRETQGERHSGQCGHISIHSLRMEGDGRTCHALPILRYFNPLPPHGGRPGCNICPPQKSYFNPLPPHGGRPL